MHSSSGSLCAKVGKIRKLLQNWEFMALQTREDWAKNDGSTAECRSIVTAWKACFIRGLVCVFLAGNTHSLDSRLQCRPLESQACSSTVIASDHTTGFAKCANNIFPL